MPKCADWPVQRTVIVHNVKSVLARSEPDRSATVPEHSACVWNTNYLVYVSSLHRQTHAEAREVRAWHSGRLVQLSVRATSQPPHLNLLLRHLYVHLSVGVAERMRALCLDPSGARNAFKLRLNRPASAEMHVRRLYTVTCGAQTVMLLLPSVRSVRAPEQFRQ